MDLEPDLEKFSEENSKVEFLKYLMSFSKFCSFKPSLENLCEKLWDSFQKVSSERVADIYPIVIDSIYATLDAERKRKKQRINEKSAFYIEQILKKVWQQALMDQKITSITIVLIDKIVHICHFLNDFKSLKVLIV
jgi:hypothetical protein